MNTYYDMNLFLLVEDTGVDIVEYNKINKILGNIYIPSKLQDNIHIKSKYYHISSASLFTLKKEIKKIIDYYITDHILKVKIKLFIYDKLNKASEIIIRLFFRGINDYKVINVLSIKIGNSEMKDILNYISNKFSKDIEVLSGTVDISNI